MEERALFVRDGEDYVGTSLTQGGWDPNAANGGVVLALMGHCLDEVPSLAPMTLGRFTADLVRPVPIGRRLRVESRVVREGKKIQLVAMTVLVGDVEHAHASALRLRDADMTGPDVPVSTTAARPADALVGPEAATGFGHAAAEMPRFLQAVDMRRAPRLDGSGFGSWLRLRVPVVAGEPIRPTARVTFGFDFANLIGLDARSVSVTMINPDVTAHVLRPPTGEWIAITGDTWVNAPLGRGVSAAMLSDLDGVFAMVSMSQLVQRR